MPDKKSNSPEALLNDFIPIDLSCSQKRAASKSSSSTSSEGCEDSSPTQCVNLLVPNLDDCQVNDVSLPPSESAHPCHSDVAHSDSKCYRLERIVSNLSKTNHKDSRTKYKKGKYAGAKVFRLKPLHFDRKDSEQLSGVSPPNPRFTSSTKCKELGSSHCKHVDNLPEDLSIKVSQSGNVWGSLHDRQDESCKDKDDPQNSSYAVSNACKSQEFALRRLLQMQMSPTTLCAISEYCNLPSYQLLQQYQSLFSYNYYCQMQWHNNKLATNDLRSDHPLQMNITEKAEADLDNSEFAFSSDLIEDFNYRKRSCRALTGKHVRCGTGASPATLLTLRQKIEERQKLKKGHLEEVQTSLRSKRKSAKQKHHEQIRSASADCSLEIH